MPRVRSALALRAAALLDIVGRPHIRPTEARSSTQVISPAVLAALLCVSLLQCTFAKAGAEPLFAGALAFDALEFSGFVTLGDLDGDGKDDVALAENYVGYTAIFLANGDGTFNPSRSSVAGNGFTAIGDVNGDGKADFVATRGGIVVHLGNGDGTFQASAEYGDGYASSLALGDLNADGKMDIVAAKETVASVLLGNGDGTFQAQMDFPVRSGASSVALGDVNGDAILDIVTTGVSVLLGNGDGTFQARTDYPIVSGIIALGDVNRDVKLDIVTSTASGVSVLLGSGDGTFQATVDSPNPFNALVDLNKDGNLDIVGAGDGLHVGLGNGDGTFQSSVDYPTRGGINAGVGDVNGDGALDVVMARSTQILVYVGNGDGSFRTRVDYGVGTNPRSVAVGDVSADGKPDLVTANYGSGSVSVVLGKGNGTFNPRTDYGTGSNPNAVAMGDVNGDGMSDLAVANSGSNTVSILLGNGDGTFQTKVDYQTGMAPYSVAIADLDADGSVDLAVTNYGSSTVSVLLGNGDGTFQERVDFATGPGPYPVAVADVSGDGKPDIVTGNRDWFTVSVLLGNGDGTFLGKVDYESAGRPRTVSIADVTGDGKLDMVVAGHAGLAIHLGNGDGTFQPGPYVTEAHEAAAAVADVNGDAKADIVLVGRVILYSNLADDVVSVFLGRGDGTFDLLNGDYDAYASDLAIGDVSGDGRPDIVVTIPSRVNAVSVLLHLGPRTATLAADLDLSPHVINLSNHAPWVTAYVEPLGFDPASIDLATVRLEGSVPAVARSTVVGDHDSDGNPDLMLRFSRSALDPLLTLGVNSLELSGSLVTGESFAGTDEIRVIHPGGGQRNASVAPNPFNPSGVLAFRTLSPGRVTVTMYDVHGRLVRTLMEEAVLPAGYQEVRIDGRGTKGEVLPSGVYFYNVRSRDGDFTGRFAIVK